MIVISGHRVIVGVNGDGSRDDAERSRPIPIPSGFEFLVVDSRRPKFVLIYGRCNLQLTARSVHPFQVRGRCVIQPQQPSHKAAS